MILRFPTLRWAPPHRVSCLLAGEQRPYPEIAGSYSDCTWIFHLPDQAEAIPVLLSLDGQLERDFIVGPGDTELAGGDGTFPGALIDIDSTRLSRTWFPQGADRDLWDVVVVGTGMGGGVCLYRLAQALKAGAFPGSVLGLEAGGMPLPGHIGNLPRELGRPDSAGATTLWRMYPDFGIVPYDVTPPEGAAHWTGRNFFGLGGRTLFWGCVTPRMTAEDLRYWPEAIVNDLTVDRDGTGTYYDRAEQFLSVGWHDNLLGKRALELLDRLYPSRQNATGPVAMRTEKPTNWRIPGGLMSTAELLIESRLDGRVGPAAPGWPYVHLHEFVTHLYREGDHWAVGGINLTDGSRTVRRARRVVLAAGSIETVRIALTSNDASSGSLFNSQMIGAGLTEHPMMYVHFRLPPSSPFAYPETSAKLLSTGRGADDNWMFQLELGSDQMLGWSTGGLSYQPADTDVGGDGGIAGQLVFLSSIPLGPSAVTREGTTEWPQTNSATRSVGLRLSWLPAGLDDALVATWQECADRLLTALGATRLPDETPPSAPRGAFPLRWAEPGFVAHEVGTMRVGVVVDENLAIVDKSAPDVFVCDNSVFPRSPAANPSLTLAALAIRLADHLTNLQK